MKLDLKREIQQLAKCGKPNIESVKERTQAFKITLQNKFDLLNKENEESVDRLNDNLTTVIKNQQQLWKQQHAGNNLENEL